MAEYKEGERVLVDGAVHGPKGSNIVAKFGKELAKSGAGKAWYLVRVISADNVYCKLIED